MALSDRCQWLWLWASKSHTVWASWMFGTLLKTGVCWQPWWACWLNVSVCHVHHQTNWPACPQVHLSIKNASCFISSNIFKSNFVARLTWQLFFDTVLDVSCLLDCCWVWEFSLIIGCGIQVVWHGCKAWQFQKSKDGQSLPSAKMFPNQPHGFAIIGEGAVCHHYTKSTRKAAQTAVESERVA